MRGRGARGKGPRPRRGRGRGARGERGEAGGAAGPARWVPRAPRPDVGAETPCPRPTTPQRRHVSKDGATSPAAKAGPRGEPSRMR